MVKLYTSLVALALLTGSALAFSDEFQRRSELDSDLYSREFLDSDNQEIFTREDFEDLYIREIFDDLEAREPGFGALFGLGAKLIGKGVSKGIAKKAAGSAAKRAGHYVVKHPGRVQNRIQNGYSTYQNLRSRELDGEDLFGREYYDDLD